MLLVILLTLSCIVYAQPYAFGWNCLKTPHACMNACYATQCAPGPAFLTRGPVGTSDDQRKRAGCAGSPCGVLPWAAPGTSCDEYPFANTLEGGWGSFLRCIPLVENLSQGGQIRNFYYNIPVAVGQSYYVFLDNWAGLTFCSFPLNCVNDGQQFQTHRILNKRGEETQLPILLPNDNDDNAPKMKPLRRFIAQGNVTLMLLSNDTTTNFVGVIVDVADVGKVQIQTEIKQEGDDDDDGGGGGGGDGDDYS